MNALRAVLAALGVGVAAAGLAMIVDPSLAGIVPSGQQVVQVVGILAAVQGGRVLWHRYRSDLRAGTVEEDPESVPTGPTPGAAFDDLATAAGNVESGRTLRSRRNRLRRRLRRAIVAALGRRRDLDREAALEAVEAGTWTDDPAAAALFTDDATDGDSAGLFERSGSGVLTRRANRAAVAVAELVGVDAANRPTRGSDADRGDDPGRRDVTDRRSGHDRREAGGGSEQATRTPVTAGGGRTTESDGSARAPDGADRPSDAADRSAEGPR